MLQTFEWIISSLQTGILSTGLSNALNRFLTVTSTVQMT